MAGWLHGDRLLSRRRFRGRVAELCLAAWAVAFVAVPAGHLLRHRGDHQHRADGAVLWVRHGAQKAHAHPHSHDAAPEGEHGRGDAAHLAAALLAPAWAWPPLCAAPAPEGALAEAPEAPHLPPRATSVSARGPPALHA